MDIVKKTHISNHGDTEPRSIINSSRCLREAYSQSAVTQWFKRGCAIIVIDSRGNPMSFLDSFSFDRLLWLVPVFFMLHNLEEAPFMESWSKRLPLKIHPTVSTRQFVIAVIFLTLGGFLVTYYGVEYLANQTGHLIVLGIQAILLFNAFIPHIATTIRFRMYSPGVITATLITLPFSFYLFRRALSENILTWTQFWIVLGIAPFAMVTFAFLSLQIGKAFDN